MSGALRIPGGVVESLRNVGADVQVTEQVQVHGDRLATVPNASVRSPGTEPVSP